MRDDESTALTVDRNNSNTPQLRPRSVAVLVTSSLPIEGCPEETREQEKVTRALMPSPATNNVEY